MPAASTNACYMSDWYNQTSVSVTPSVNPNYTQTTWTYTPSWTTGDPILYGTVDAGDTIAGEDYGVVLPSQWLTAGEWRFVQFEQPETPVEARPCVLDDQRPRAIRVR